MSPDIAAQQHGVAWQNLGGTDRQLVMGMNTQSESEHSHH
jgi:hypothetical protein